MKNSLFEFLNQDAEPRPLLVGDSVGNSDVERNSDVW